ncbi:hypothetical protein GH714_034667 [Hevea brasiliensis]|uniref:Uncharacterized protein n=1 Tax=Hevea brasiliensis TaxID=3981 RepID=A0A6A6KA53_HEVBR|nr:hypothetical protein GH714_034667 [Hevea brasiliensis]
MENVTFGDGGIWSTYTKDDIGGCSRAKAIKNLEHVRVFSQKLEPDIGQIKALRRQCCDISPSFNESMVISIRQCGTDELISMHF